MPASATASRTIERVQALTNATRLYDEAAELLQVIEDVGDLLVVLERLGEKRLLLTSGEHARDQLVQGLVHAGELVDDVDVPAGLAERQAELVERLRQADPGRLRSDLRAACEPLIVLHDLADDLKASLWQALHDDDDDDAGDAG